MSNGDQLDAGTVEAEQEDKALLSIVNALRALDSAARLRVWSAISVYFDFNPQPGQRSAAVPFIERMTQEPQTSAQPSFSEDRAPSPKAFLLQKRPVSDVERVVCLAYYLAHYRQQAHFKTVDVGKLNTEAAQPKFSNASQAVDNATKAGLLVPAVRGTKQIGAAGELYVQALPDRQAARAAAAAQFTRKKKGRRNGRTSAQPTGKSTMDESGEEGLAE